MFTELLDAVFPARCAGCARRGAAICDACARTVRSAAPAPPPAGVATLTSCFAYEGVVREVIARAKYRDERRALSGLAHHLAAAIRVEADLVTWSPASVDRRRARGVDHGELIARVVGRHLGVPVATTLRRAGPAAQTGRSAAERRLGPDVRAPGPITASAVLVVDDVTTTGGTLAAAARALRAAGAGTIHAATIARTGRGRGRAEGRPEGPNQALPILAAPIRESSSSGRAWTSSSSASTWTSMRSFGPSPSRRSTA